MENESKEKLRASDYDLIAFDMDQTIAEYYLKPYLKLHTESLFTTLILDYGYPKEIFPENGSEEEEKLFKFPFRCFVDKRNLNILKVSENLEVLRGYNGYDRLSMEEIKETYGENPRIDELDKEEFSSENFFPIKDFFQTRFLLTFIRVSHLKKNGNEFFKDVNFERIYEDLKSYLDTLRPLQINPQAMNQGDYYRILKARPQKFYKKMEEKLKSALISLKKKGVITMLITNSPYGPFNMIYPYISDDNDNEIFSNYGLHAQKPKFFDNPQKEIFLLDTSFEESFDENSPVNLKEFDFTKNKFFYHGNANCIEEYLKRKTGKEKVNCLYFGDNPTHDMHCRHYDHWDCAFIYAEYGEIKEKFEENIIHDYQDIWGSALYGENCFGEKVKTFMFGLVEREFNFVFDSVNSDECCEFLRS